MNDEREGRPMMTKEEQDKIDELNAAFAAGTPEVRGKVGAKAVTGDAEAKARAVLKASLGDLLKSRKP